MASVQVIDETAHGGATGSLTVEFLAERVSAREVIRARVYQEVSEFNARRSAFFTGLVQPTDAERTVQGFRLRAHRPLDWERQFEAACRAFETNGFVLLVGDRQLDDLDDEIDLHPGTSVTFLRLTPLVGG